MGELRTASYKCYGNSIKKSRVTFSFSTAHTLTDLRRADIERKNRNAIKIRKHLKTKMFTFEEANDISHTASHFIFSGYSSL